METDPKDVKTKGVQRDAKRSPRITYTPRQDVTPESELSALTAVYAFVIQAHMRKKAATPMTKGQKEENQEERRPGQGQ